MRALSTDLAGPDGPSWSPYLIITLAVLVALFLAFRIARRRNR